MFCPNCSQQQVSDDISFCKSCGFSLADVSEALKNDGYIERNIDLTQYAEDISQYARELKKSVAKGTIVMTLSLVFFILSFIFGTPEPSYAVQFNVLVGVLMFMTGVFLIGSSFFKKPGDKLAREKLQTNSNRRTQLFENQPVGFTLPPKDASELVNAGTFHTNPLKPEQVVRQPASATEGTTKLLNKEE